MNEEIIKIEITRVSKEEVKVTLHGRDEVIETEDFDDYLDTLDFIDDQILLLVPA